MLGEAAHAVGGCGRELWQGTSQDCPQPEALRPIKGLGFRV